jgi:Restriction endonuclease
VTEDRKWTRSDAITEHLIELFNLFPDGAGFVLALVLFAGTVAVHDATRGHGPVVDLAVISAGFLLVATALTFAIRRIVNDSDRWKFLEVQRHMGDVLGLNGLAFEGMAAELFEARGYHVRRRGGARSDAGIDLLVKQGGQWALVQCKQRRWGRVTVQEVREFAAVVAHHKAPMGILLTSGLFSPDARDWASGEPLQLIDGPALWQMIEGVRKQPETVART